MTAKILKSTKESTTKSKPTKTLLPSVTLPLKKSYTYASPVPVLLAENKLGKVNEPCVLGVDEAGRGPCLGPMVYAVCYCALSRHQELRSLGFDDSKKLTEEKRDELAKIIQENQDWIGWAVYVISPRDISTNMHRRPVYNLNEMAHDATIKLIRNVVEERLNLEEIYVDPVGPSASYKKKLSFFFPNSQITVEPKADSLYPIVSAASICAKVTRDQFVQNWIWTESEFEGIVSKEFGSGYPSDPNTIRWMNQNEDEFFGFPSIMRFSWKTISNRMNQTRNVEWSEDEDEEPTTKQGAKEKAEKKAREAQKRKEAAKYNHHKRGKIVGNFSLDVESSI